MRRNRERRADIPCHVSTVAPTSEYLYRVIKLTAERAHLRRINNPPRSHYAVIEVVIPEPLRETLWDRVIKGDVMSDSARENMRPPSSPAIVQCSNR
jgi:hypothetical protein